MPGQESLERQRHFERVGGPEYDAFAEQQQVNIIPSLPESEELALMHEMTTKLTETCDEEIRTQSGAAVRDKVLIESVLGSRAFRDEDGHDWPIDITATSFILRHQGTPEARALDEAMKRAYGIVRKPRS